MPTPEIRGPSCARVFFAGCYSKSLCTIYFGGPSNNNATVAPSGPCTFILHTLKFDTLVRMDLSKHGSNILRNWEFSRAHFAMRPRLVHSKNKKFSKFSVTSNFATHIWSIKYRWKQKLIAQFVYKLRDESFMSNYSMIEQCLSNKNERAKYQNKKKWSKQGLSVLCCHLPLYNKLQVAMTFLLHRFCYISKHIIISRYNSKVNVPK